MAFDLRSLPSFLGDDATWRTWAQGIHAQLTACGLVVASDTGQVDLTTANRPAANNYAGYKIYRFNDDLHNTGGKQLFIKWEYGVGAAVDRPGQRVTLSTGTNGAGTPTGIVASAFTLVSGASSGAGVSRPSYCSGDGSRLCLLSNIDNSTSSLKFHIILDRSRNADGTGAGACVWYWFNTGSGSPTSMSVLPFVGSVPGAGSAATSLAMVNFTGAGGASVAGSDVCLFPLFCIYGRPYPILPIIGYMSADIGVGIPFTSSDWLGAARTWMPLGGSTAGIATLAGQQNMAMLWE